MGRSTQFPSPSLRSLESIGPARPQWGVGKEQVGKAVKPTAEYEEKPLERIPEPEKGALAGEAAGERFQREKRLLAEWKSMRRLRIQGSAGATRALGTAPRDRSLGGIWRPVRAVRHPRRLKPAPAPNHAPGTQEGGVDKGGGWDTEAPRSAQDALGLEERHRWVVQARAAGAPEPGSALRWSAPAGRARWFLRGSFLSTGSCPWQVQSQDRRPLCPRTPRDQRHALEGLVSALPTRERCDVCVCLRVSLRVYLMPTFRLKTKCSQEAALIGVDCLLLVSAPRVWIVEGIRMGACSAPFDTKFVRVFKKGAKKDLRKGFSRGLPEAAFPPA